MKKGLLVIALITAVIAFNACHKQGSDNNVNSNGGGTVYVDLPLNTASYFTGFNTGIFNLKATVGRVLFYDKHLSVNNAIACASCHKQEAAFADNVALSRGFENKLTVRNSPPLENLVDNSRFLGDPLSGSAGVALFWDSRLFNLVDLVSRPISNHVEMGIADLSILPAKLQALHYYNNLFAQAYGNDSITTQRITECVAYFVASIKADSTRVDMYNAGTGQLSALEQQGQTLFRVKFQCTNCHNINPGAYKADGIIDIGLETDYVDLGLGAIKPGAENNGRFRVPNLRNVGITAPYMHDGRFKTLGEVIDHYSTGVLNSPNLDRHLKDAAGNPVKMNISEQEKTALIAFLNAFTDYKTITDPKYANPFKVK